MAMRQLRRSTEFLREALIEVTGPDAHRALGYDNDRLDSLGGHSVTKLWELEQYANDLETA